MKEGLKLAQFGFFGGLFKKKGSKKESSTRTKKVPSKTKKKKASTVTLNKKEISKKSELKEEVKPKLKDVYSKQI